jgi:biopolymer transport protein TolR
MSHSYERRGRARSDLPMNAEINVTSLVDVAFTLLVIFIITAPIMQGGIEVALPRADVPPLTSEDAPLFITITREGTVFLEDAPVSLEELEAGLPQLLATGSVERVYIRGDSLAPYGPVLKVMGAAVQSGVPWSVVGTPYEGGR